MSGHGCTTAAWVFEGSGPQRHHAVDMIEDATWKLVHDPASCALCDPAYDQADEIRQGGVAA
jgi:hypothetical protein